MQPASAFEQLGVEELAKQTISVLNIQTVPQEVFDRQLAFNLYPAPERNEEFITSQIRALTDPDAQLALLITQGTIFHGHTFSLFLKTKEALDVDADHGHVARECRHRVRRGRPGVRHDRRGGEGRSSHRRSARRRIDPRRLLGLGRLR